MSQSTKSSSRGFTYFSSYLITYPEKDFRSFHQGDALEALEAMASLLDGGARNLRNTADLLRELREDHPGARCTFRGVTDDFLLQVTGTEPVIDRLKQAHLVHELTDLDRILAIYHNQTDAYDLTS